MNEQQINSPQQQENIAQGDNELVRRIAEQKYEFGFTTDVHTEIIPVGLNEDVVRLISQKKGEPEWMLAFRLRAYNYWKDQTEPKWGHVHVPTIDYQSISYYADPTAKKAEKSGDSKTIDPELEKTFDKLGIPLEERLALSGNTAVDAIMDSVSVKTTFKEVLREKGVIFCSIGEAVKEHPDLVREYLGSVVPYKDNYFAALNSAVFSDGSFVYIPKGVRCPMELSSYFRINAKNTGQFERTLIIADDDSYVSYLEGCTAPMRDENQLHAAIVEIIVKERAEVKYSTVQNWYPGDEQGRGGVLNLVTKRGDLRGADSKLSWTQVETGSAITWKYPSCILRGDNSTAEFYSVAVTNNYQEADTGTKMIHLGKNTKSTIISKGISAGHSQNSYRGLVRAAATAENARNYSSCDSLLLGSQCGAHTFPYMDVKNPTAIFEHEATTSKISEDQLFYCNQRGIPTEQAVGLIVNGYAKDVLNKLPMEFAAEARKLLSVSLEGTVG
jgi:Fe-S cluster assembly protein SufB